MQSKTHMLAGPLTGAGSRLGSAALPTSSWSEVAVSILTLEMCLPELTFPEFSKGPEP